MRERKTRSDAALLTLDSEVQQELFEELRAGMSYRQALLWVEREHGVKSSMGAMHHFWQVRAKEYSENRIMKAVVAAQDIEELAHEQLPMITDATMNALTQAAFEAALSADSKKTKVFMDIVLKANAQQLECRKVAIQEKRLELLDQAEAVVKEEHTPEEREKKLKEIFGIG